MSRSEQNQSGNRRHKRAIGCCFGLPVLLVSGLYACYLFNNRLPDLVVPTPAVPADNARDYFLKAYTLTKGMQHKSPYLMSGPAGQKYTYANFAACARDAVPALQMLQEGLKHPYWEPPLRSLHNHAIANAKLDYAAFRSLERVSAGAANFEAISGHPGRSAQMHLDGMEMGVMLARGGNGLTALTSFHCEDIAETRLEWLLPQLSAQELARVAERLDRIEAKRTPYADTILEEGNSDTATTLELFRDPTFKARNPFVSADSLLFSGNTNSDLPFGERMQQNIEVTKFVLQNKAVLLQQRQQWYRKRADETGKPYVGESRVPTPDIFFAANLAPALDKLRLQTTAIKTIAIILRVETALYRYKSAHGRFPEALAELCPTYLKTVPNDPFGGGAGKPLQYQVKANGKSFLLYSFGADLDDDGGIAGQDHISIPGDIVAGHLFNYKPILSSGQSASF